MNDDKTNPAGLQCVSEGSKEPKQSSCKNKNKLSDPQERGP
jgi:hypothetical protein